MHRRYFLIVTALGEGGIGLLLLVSPSIPQLLLLGVETISPETSIVARITGAALLAIGVICWQAISNTEGVALQGLLWGILIYDLAAALILAYSGLFVGLAGIALWPAAGLHVVLAVWCIMCLGN